MGSFQSGHPHPVSIQNNYHKITIDIKDCFFSILTAQQGKPYFAFTVWEPNTGIPEQRYQWTVLYQGMKNSPPMCQHFVSHATRPLIKQCLIMHYMDDILLAHRDSATLLTCLKKILANLTSLGYMWQLTKFSTNHPLSF